MIFISTIKADFGGSVGFSVPQEQWEWNANRGVGVLFECLDKSNGVLFRRKTEYKMNEVDFFLKNGTFHYIDFPMLVNSTCSKILSTLYISDGDNAQGCKTKAKNNLDDCDLQKQDPAADAASQQYPAIKDMSPAEQKAYATYAKANYQELSTKSVAQILAYLAKPENADAKATVDADYAINGKASEDSAADASTDTKDTPADDTTTSKKVIAIKDMTAEQKKSYAAFASQQFKELQGKTQAQVLAYLQANPDAKKQVDEAFVKNADSGSQKAVTPLAQMTAEQQSQYAEFAIESFQEIQDMATKAKKSATGTSAQKQAAAVKKVIAYLKANPDAKKQVDEALMSTEDTSAEDATEDDSSQLNIQKRSIHKRQAADCGKKRVILQVSCPKHGLDSKLQSVIADKHTTTLEEVESNTDDSPADDILPQ